jgi:Domain of unknown function (DUF4136)
MRIRNIAAAIALGTAAVTLSACAESITSTVSRYQAMPAPQGQTFFVVPDGGMAHNGGLEFQRYAGLVAQQLEAHGYRPATNAQNANMIVQLGYGVDRGQVRYQSYGFGGYWGSPFYWPRWGWGGGYYWGWNDPFWDGGIDSYIEYHSQVEVHIRQSGTNAPLFDGRAIARSYTDRLDVVVPSLLDAMFTGFPGQNGETVKITIPPRQQAHS